MKFEVRAKRGAVNLILLDDAGNVVFDLDGIPAEDARDMSKLLRRAARAADSGIDGAQSVESKRPSS